MNDSDEARAPDTHPLLEELDAYREQHVEAIFSALGDHGANVDQIEALLEALGDALWSAHDASTRIAHGEDVGRKARGQARRLTTIEEATRALLAFKKK